MDPNYALIETYNIQFKNPLRRMIFEAVMAVKMEIRFVLVEPSYSSL